MEIITPRLVKRAAIFGITAFFALLGQHPSLAQTPVAGKVAFSSNRTDNNNEIYLMNLDGTGVQRLTYSSFSDTRPALSPDGTKVAFVSDRDGAQGSNITEIYIINSDGTGLQRLTHNGASNDYPVWNPDGTKIAFTSTQNSAYKIYKMDANGANVTPVTDADSYYISWGMTPAGEKISFDRVQNNGSYSYEAPWTVNPDGSNPAQENSSLFTSAYSPDGTKRVGVRYYGGYVITILNSDGSTFYDFDPPYSLVPDRAVFSADGQKVIFTAETYDPQKQTLTHHDLFSVNLNGTGLMQLTHTQGEEQDPSCAPGITVTVPTAPTGFGRLAYSWSGDIWTADPTGWDYRQVTHTTKAYHPSFSPNGQKIAYDDGQNIWVMQADGSNPTKLTNYPDAGYDGGYASTPCWSPDGLQIAYDCTNDGSPYYYHYRIWSMNADGTGQTCLIGGKVYPDPDNPGYWKGDLPGIPCASPAWGSGGILSWEGGPYYESGIGLGNYNKLISNGSPNAYPNINYGDPVWSADGSKIFFYCSTPANDGTYNYSQGIWEMDPFGKNVQALTQHLAANGGPNVDSHPTASPDNQSIAFLRSGALWVMSTSGSNQTQITPVGFVSGEDLNWGNNFDYSSPDNQSPTVSITDPVTSGTSRLLQVQGTAHDTIINASGVSAVWLKLQRLSDNSYWNPAATGAQRWGTATTLLPSTLGNPDNSTPAMNAWSAKNLQQGGSLPNPDDLADGQYKLYAYAVDTAGNASSEVVSTFTVIHPGTLQFSTTDYHVIENTGAITPGAITVTRTGGSDGTVTVDYATSSYGDGTDATAGSATANVDYTPVSGTLTFGPGETSKTITVSITDDNLLEGDESLYVTLSNPTGQAELSSQNTAYVTITDDETTNAGKFSFSKQSYVAHENDGTVNLVINRTNGSTGAVTLQLSSYTSDATPRYSGLPDSVTFASGEITKTIPITLADDAASETNETVYFYFNNSALGSNGNGYATLTIIDDESAALAGSFQFDASTYTLSKTDTNVTISVTRTGGSQGEKTFTYTVNSNDPGTAQEYSDYYFSGGGQVTFADGDTAAKTFDVTAWNHSFTEDRTINLVLQDSTGLTIATATVTMKGSGSNPTGSTYQPDSGFVSVAHGKLQLLIGAGTYSNDGASEIDAISVKKKKTKSVNIGFFNAGTSSDSFWVQAPATVGGYKVTYSLCTVINPNGTDITKKLTKLNGGYLTPSINAGKICTKWIKAAVKAPSSETTKDILITTFSDSDSSKQDVLDLRASIAP